MSNKEEITAIPVYLSEIEKYNWDKFYVPEIKDGNHALTFYIMLTTTPAIVLAASKNIAKSIRFFDSDLLDDVFPEDSYKHFRKIIKTNLKIKEKIKQILNDDFDERLSE